MSYRVMVIYGLSLVFLIGGFLLKWTGHDVPEASVIIVGVLGITIGSQLQDLSARVSKLENRQTDQK
jgi:hypothetical protein